jgi:hypothetical protein
MQVVSRNCHDRSAAGRFTALQRDHPRGKLLGAEEPRPRARFVNTTKTRRRFIFKELA